MEMKFETIKEVMKRASNIDGKGLIYPTMRIMFKRPIIVKCLADHVVKNTFYPYPCGYAKGYYATYIVYPKRLRGYSMSEIVERSEKKDVTCKFIGWWHK
jgi:hypothetical protein